MLFNSFDFLLFLPIVFLLYWFVFKSRKIQNLFLVAASYVFYGWWDWRFLFLIAITSICSTRALRGETEMAVDGEFCQYHTEFVDTWYI